MEKYDSSELGSAPTYMSQSVDMTLNLTSPIAEQSETMNNEGAPELIAGQGFYYPTSSNYGYYCTGFESPGEWGDHPMIFGVDGPDIHCMGAQNELLPYVYYTPSYGYGQSQYSPYHSYIPSGMIGVDGPFSGAQQYYPLTFQNTVSSPAYPPIVIQPDVTPNSPSYSMLDSSVDRHNERRVKTASSGTFSTNTSKTSRNQSTSLARVSERPKPNVGSAKQSLAHGSASAGLAPPYVLQDRSASSSIQRIDNISSVNGLSHRDQLKVSLPIYSPLSDFGPSYYGRMTAGRFQSKMGRAFNDEIGSPDEFTEQNRGPRINRSKNQLAVKANAIKAGDSNAEGNIIISTDQYNKDNFPIDYTDAKFFVIKSYSEDDVHKSIKYNVWSSTPHGNKKLNGAYEDAQRIAEGKPKGCPIFLFFSVNTSGQFCGVAEMVGPVDFNEDMDFWQQDKWSGSFPVTWHIIKDVPNMHFRRIILENNENKPVTNSRDSQEIMCEKGLEMLKVFKYHPLKTSLLDDFMYYEKRQKIMQERKSRLLIESIEGPFLIDSMDPPRKSSRVVELLPTEDKKGDPTWTRNMTSTLEKVSSNSAVTNSAFANKNAEEVSAEAKDGATLTVKIGSLSVSQNKAEPKASASAVACLKNPNVVTVGSVPLNVNGFAEASVTLKIGTIPLDPIALQADKADASLDKEIGEK